MPYLSLEFARNGAGAYAQFFVNQGTAFAVGYNANGQLGIGNTTTQLTRQTLAGDQWGTFSTNVDASGNGCSVAVKLDGTLWSCGYMWGPLGYATPAADVTSFVQIGAATTWAAAYVAVGAGAAYALTTAGALYSWGSNTYGELALGAAGGTYTLPTAVAGAWAAIACPKEAFLGIKTDGTLWACGRNGDGSAWGGVLGLGDTVNRSALTQVGVATDWAEISCGSAHCAAIRSDGTLWTWGYNGNGQLGQGDTTQRLEATQVGALTTWSKVACGDNATYALKTDGTLWSCGYRPHAVLGATTNNVTSFTQIGVDTNWSLVASAGRSLFVKDSSGNIYGGGENNWGVLTLGDETVRSTLTAIPTSFAAPVNQTVADAGIAADALVTLAERVSTITEASTVADTLADSTFTMYLEAIGLSDSLAAGANTTTAYADSAAMLDVIQQAINQIVADSVAGADNFSLGAALTLVDVADAVASQTSSVSGTLLVAELIATLEAYNGADAYDITESGALSDAYVARVEALVALLDEYYIQDVNVATVSVYQLATDSADGAAAITSAGGVLSALLADSALATIRLNIGGETFTGWVLNTDTMAPSEYQFADRQFNSACKHGNRYLMAADDGIYEFTDDAGVESVMTYIKTGKTDFGSDLKKRVVNSYMVYSASGQMVLKVTTSEFGNLVTRNYRMTPQAADTTDARRIDIGKGVKSRYWQFEVVGEGVDCDIDEIGMLPIVLSRRI